ncbi:hypothetical protein [Gordonia westfalica]|nr:hypothetical protein [Gordonia westfalica]
MRPRRDDQVSNDRPLPIPTRLGPLPHEYLAGTASADQHADERRAGDHA